MDVVASAVICLGNAAATVGVIVYEWCKDTVSAKVAATADINANVIVKVNPSNFAIDIGNPTSTSTTTTPIIVTTSITVISPTISVSVIVLGTAIAIVIATGIGATASQLWAG